MTTLGVRDVDVARETDRDAAAAEDQKPLGIWLQKPSLRHVKGQLHERTSPGRYRDRRGRLWETPVGGFSDGGSTPRVVWWLYPPFGADYEASFDLHDHVYAHAEDYPGSDHGHLSRGEADDLMLEAMEAEGFRASGRRTVWLAVRAGGWWAWRRHRQAARQASTSP